MFESRTAHHLLSESETAIHPMTRQLLALNFATIAVMSSCCS